MLDFIKNEISKYTFIFNKGNFIHCSQNLYDIQSLFYGSNTENLMF